MAAFAVIDPQPAQVTHMHTASSDVTDWHDLANQAEVNGIAPLIIRNIRNHGVVIDSSSRRHLNALVLRHREADRILNQALIEILHTCAHRQLNTLVLKGGALAHLVYPDSGLRPRRDIDLLADTNQASHVQRELAQLGYDTPAEHPVRAMRYHHHLPVASRVIDQLTVSVEVHSDALSGDYPERLNMATCHDRPQAFGIDGTPAYAFGHRDMLRHLCCHALEPGEPMRLMALADIIGYAHHFARQIDWYALQRSHPKVLHTLQHLHYLQPLPSSVEFLKPCPAIPAPAELGKICLR